MSTDMLRRLTNCRLLTRIKRTCYTIENKIMKMQMNKKKKNTI